jgi:CheY-like chemotaxis protein
MIMRVKIIMGNTILLVDDIQMFIEIQKEFLQDSQVNILAARNGLDALGVIKTRRPDLIFMDLQMPVMDGAASCRAIKSDPTLRNIPVVMISSGGNLDYREQCFSAGCDDFLTKPLDRDHFLEIAKRFIPTINRREKRIPFKADVSILINHETLSCILYNLSMGGVYVESNYQASPRDVIRISFSLPDGTRIDCPGRIAWVNNGISKMPRGFGVQFALLPNNAKEALTKIIFALK